MNGCEPIPIFTRVPIRMQPAFIMMPAPAPKPPLVMSVMALPLSNLIRLALTVFLMVASQIWTRFAGRKISAARFGRRLAIAPICCLARMANLPRLGRSGLPSGSKPLTRYGLKSRHRLICPKRWPKWQAPPQFQLPLASGFAANMSFRASCNAGQPPFYSRILGVLAEF